MVAGNAREEERIIQSASAAVEFITCFPTQSRRDQFKNKERLFYI